MALTIPKAVEASFHFHITSEEHLAEIRRIDSEEAAGMETDTVFTVKFRQGTIGDDNLRTTYINTRRLKQEDGQYVTVSDINQNSLGKMEMRLTLCETDLALQDESKLDFMQSGSIRRVKSDSQFDRWYNSLPSQWANEIYKACLEVNPSWDPSKRISELSD